MSTFPFAPSCPHPAPPRTAAQARQGVCCAARALAPPTPSRDFVRCRTDAGEAARPLKLADAQLAIAREAGFASWPKLVADMKERDLEAFRDAVGRRDATRVARLLAEPHVRAHVNDPLFDFGQRAAHVAAKDRALLALLLDAGADLNLQSDWQNGPYTVLDRADEPTARFLLSRGATLTANVAARLGWFEPSSRRCCAPIPRSSTRAAATASSPCTRRRASPSPISCSTAAPTSTPAASITSRRRRSTRWSIAPRSPGTCSTAARRPTSSWPRVSAIARSPSGCSTPIRPPWTAHVHEPGYAPVPPFNIYCWSLGFGSSPHDVAKKYGHEEVFALLTARSSPRVLLRTAILAADARRARALVAADPTLLASLSRAEHGHLAQAIFHERLRRRASDARPRLRSGSPRSGRRRRRCTPPAGWATSAWWSASSSCGAVPLDAPDPTHQSPPLGWAAYGSVHRRAPGGDYPAVAERLVAAGADIRATGNLHGRTLVEMANGNPEMQEALRRLGAV